MFQEIYRKCSLVNLQFVLTGFETFLVSVTFLKRGRDIHLMQFFIEVQCSFSCRHNKLISCEEIFSRFFF